ncbi:MAG: class I SAM-dependent methyltransferase [Alphaproteobacteria bacterium]|jgi:SAM-dependent methyltransferase|nr:class I SAM-dependent methyltransferase [Alphaproteobacteria bacterium]
MNKPLKISGDKDVDGRYDYLRNRHGTANPAANGYRLDRIFKRDQEALFSAIDRNNGPFLDIACGSGLMLAPLLNQGHNVYGLDFNADACVAAHMNGIKIIRGDAFNTPLPDGTIGQIVNCQFLNQQPAAQTEKFIQESARVLKPGGQLIILWRHARSFIHISAHAVFTVLDKFSGQPPFPQYVHSFKEIESFAAKAGLTVEKKAVTLPFLGLRMISPDAPGANIIGASQFLVLRKS